MRMIFLILTLNILSWRNAAAFQGVFWDICDVHLNISYTTNENGGFGNYIKDSSVLLMRSAFQAMKTIYPNPAFIIVNGDNVYHGDNDFVKTIGNVSAELASYFPNAIIFPTLGNHDVERRNQLELNSTWCEKLFEHWKPFFKDANQSDILTFNTGCYYSRLITSEDGTLLVLVFNTLLWYARNDYTNIVNDPMGQFAWIEDKLQMARVKNYKVFVMAHIPPGASEFSTYIIKHLHPSFNKRILEILQANVDVIDAGFFAHQHTDAFKIVYNLKSEPVIPIFQSPSVTPFYLWSLGSVNPSIRLYNWTKTSSQSSYDQYHTGLTPKVDNSNASYLNWTLEYNSKSMLPGLSAQHLHDLVNDLSLESSKYFESFFDHHLSGFPHDDQKCSAGSPCRCQFVCVMKNIDYSILDYCLKNCPGFSVLWICLVSAAVALLIILVVIGVLVYRFHFWKKHTSDQNPKHVNQNMDLI